jgi:hypothetical protein
MPIDLTYLFSSHQSAYITFLYSCKEQEKQHSHADVVKSPREFAISATMIELAGFLIAHKSQPVGPYQISTARKFWSVYMYLIV